MNALQLIDGIEAPLALALRRVVEQRSSDKRDISDFVRATFPHLPVQLYTLTDILFILDLVRGDLSHFYPTEKGLQAHAMGLKAFFENQRRLERLRQIRSAVAFIVLLLTFIANLAGVMR